MAIPRWDNVETGPLNEAERAELLELLAALGPLTGRLEELLARGGGAGLAGSDYWNLGSRAGFGVTRSLDEAIGPDVHDRRGRNISGRRTAPPSARALPRTRGVDARPEAAARGVEPINPGPPTDRAIKIRDVTGPGGLSDQFGMAATDLGVLTLTPSGRILAIFGDTFRDAFVGSPDWRATVGLISDTKNLDEGLVWTEAAGHDRHYARQLWDYPHLPCPGGASTVLPSDVMTIGNTMYLHTSAHFPFGNVAFTELWKSDNDGFSWQRHGPRWEDPFLHGGLGQLWTFDKGDDGFVYVMSTGFRVTRDQPIILQRVPADRLDDPRAYQGWGFGPDGWAWGNEPTPVLDGGYGELCLRRIDGVWVLVAFNARHYRLDVRVFRDITSNLNDAITLSPIVGGDWGAERDDSVAQLYGPSIIPGSRPGSGFHILLSQWRNPGSWPYHVMQFKIPMPGARGAPSAPKKVPAPRKRPAKKVPAKKIPAKKVPPKKAPARKRAPKPDRNDD